MDGIMSRDFPNATLPEEDRAKVLGKLIPICMIIFVLPTAFWCILTSFKV